jgi:hypothetical protein
MIIPLSPDLEARLKAWAARENRPAEVLVAELLERNVPDPLRETVGSIQVFLTKLDAALEGIELNDELFEYNREQRRQILDDYLAQKYLSVNEVVE